MIRWGVIEGEVIPARYVGHPAIASQVPPSHAENVG
jgi:hypothetical protein